MAGVDNWSYVTVSSVESLCADDSKSQFIWRSSNSVHMGDRTPQGRGCSGRWGLPVGCCCCCCVVFGDYVPSLATNLTTSEANRYRAPLFADIQPAIRIICASIQRRAHLMLNCLSTLTIELERFKMQRAGSLFFGQPSSQIWANYTFETRVGLSFYSGRCTSQNELENVSFVRVPWGVIWFTAAICMRWDLLGFHCIVYDKKFN